jgi:FtsH-binding integral membrane protein
MNTYVKKTYFYVIVALIISLLTFFYTDKKGIDTSDTNKKIWIPFLFALIMLLLVFYINDPFFNHVVWVLFIVSSSYFLYPVYKKYASGKLNTILISLIILTLIVIVYGSKTSKNFSGMSNYLFFGLIAFIIFQLTDSFLNKENENEESKKKKEKFYGIITVILFTLYLLYESNNLMRQSVYAPKNVLYTRTSLGIFIDIINIFTGGSRI